MAKALMQFFPRVRPQRFLAGPPGEQAIRAGQLDHSRHAVELVLRLQGP